MSLQLDPVSGLPVPRPTYRDFWRTSAHPAPITLDEIDRDTIRSAMMLAKSHILQEQDLAPSLFSLFPRYVGRYLTPSNRSHHLGLSLNGDLRELQVQGGVTWSECTFQKDFVTWSQARKHWGVTIDQAIDQEAMAGQADGGSSLPDEDRKRLKRAVKKRLLESDYSSTPRHTPPASSQTGTTTTASPTSGIYVADELIFAKNVHSFLAASTSEVKAILPRSQGSDILRKYRKGMGQSLAYLIQANQICGTFLGSFLLGTTFLREVMLDDRTIAVEISESVRARWRGDRTMTVKDLLEVEKGAMTQAMPWDLLQSEAFPNPEIDPTSLDTFLAFRRSAADLLLPLKVDQPLSRLEINLDGEYTKGISCRATQIDLDEDEARRTIVAAARPYFIDWDAYVRKREKEETARSRVGVELGEEIRDVEVEEQEERSDNKVSLGEDGEATEGEGGGEAKKRKKDGKARTKDDERSADDSESGSDRGGNDEGGHQGGGGGNNESGEGGNEESGEGGNDEGPAEGRHGGSGHDGSGGGGGGEGDGGRGPTESDRSPNDQELDPSDDLPLGAEASSFNESRDVLYEYLLSLPITIIPISKAEMTELVGEVCAARMRGKISTDGEKTLVDGDKTLVDTEVGTDNLLRKQVEGPTPALNPLV